MPVRELVPGDVVRVRLGDVIPADLRVLDDAALEVDQSALTGESLAVARGKGNALYSGSVLVRGEADALVYATGGRRISGGPLRWWRLRAQSATSSARCCASATTSSSLQWRSSH